MSDKIAKLEARLALVKAEQAFAEKKEDGSVTAEDKLALRELRRDFRENHRTPVKNGAQAPVIKAKAQPKKAGGE
jgi:hypothetical protein